MLINFSFTNFRSFRDKTDFTMIAGRGRFDRDTLQQVPGQRSMHLLPVCAIFGGNASGKSTFVKALAQLQHVVVSGKIETIPFMLDKAHIGAPTSFVICVLANEQVWEYELSILKKTIINESLVLIKGNSETEIFSRNDLTFHLGERAAFNQEAREKLTTLGEALAPNAVFLNAAQTYRVTGVKELLGPVFNWLQKTLCIVTASSKRAALGVDLLQNLDQYSSALSRADTGIAELRLTELNIEQVNIDPADLEHFKQSENKVIFNDEDSTLVLIKQEDGIHAYRCLSQHKTTDGDSVPFLMTDESDGTRRLLHLLPTLIDHQNQPRVYIVDELDRSLHTSLSRYLVESQLHIARTHSEHRQQLIFTTHDVMLMNQRLLRRDELWAAERGRDNASHLISFEEFIDIHKDKDIRRSYLTGHMGGLPNLTTSTY